MWLKYLSAKETKRLSTGAQEAVSAISVLRRYTLLSHLASLPGKRPKHAATGATQYEQSVLHQMEAQACGGSREPHRPCMHGNEHSRLVVTSQMRLLITCQYCSDHAFWVSQQLAA